MLGIGALLALLGGATPGPARAAEIEDVEFAERHPAGAESDASLPLRGLGLLRYRIFFKGYVAALYLPAGVPSRDVLEDVPKRLELHYFWSIPGDQFGPVAQANLVEHLGAEAVAALQTRIDELHGAYRDVSPDDRYALTYRPGVGTSLEWNGRRLVTIPGADFAAAYFGIWLGPRPLDESLRDQLLGKS